jgi:tetratricopeptide (TPR) repeat protein
MSDTPFSKSRQVVPRWPAFRDALRLGELATPKKDGPAIGIAPELRDRLEEWRTSPSIVTAAEAIETAIVEGLDYEAIEAATSILSPESTATPLVRTQATLLLERTGKLDLADAANVQIITTARHLTRERARDPFAWADLARGFATIRKDVAARRAMLVALQLAPHNRYVLRSAARLLLHLGDPEEAHDLIKRNGASRVDPWLMAAEIALSHLADKNPTFLKAGLKVIDSNQTYPRHLSELASAIGTIQLLDGNRKARQLLNKSLIDPTGNAVAQAEWATPRLGGNIVRPESIARVFDKSEALVFDAYWKKDFEGVVEACENWHDEEPFSSRPFYFGSTAANVSEQYDRAIELAKRGLQLAPRASLLINNLAFALISLRRYDDAAVLISSRLPSLVETDSAPMTATAGLLALQLGHHERGIQLYRKAISIFKRTGNVPGEALALAYFALSAVRSELPDALAIIREAKDFIKKLPSLPDAELIFERAEMWAAAVALRHNSTEQPVPAKAN